MTRCISPVRILPLFGWVLLAFCCPNVVAQSTVETATEFEYPKFDLVVRHGRIVDGTGSPWFTADIGIRDGKIASIGKIEANAGSLVLDATGLIVAPGFVDMMGQTATPMLDDPNAAMNLLTQGITTINAGEGGSAAPLSAEAGRDRGWTSMEEYFQLLNQRGLPINVVQTVGHTQVREMVMGEENRRPTDSELEAMKQLVREGMEAGAIGISTALIYPPAVYATTDEIGALAAVAGEYGGRYYTHMRNEGDQLLEAIEEALEIGRIGQTPVHIFHLKAAGRQNWGKMPLAIARIKAARAEGHEVTADIYPYINNGLGIDALIHPRHFGEGREKFLNQLKSDNQLRSVVRREMEQGTGWENWFRHAGHDWNKIVLGQTNAAEYRAYVGSSLASIAKEAEVDVWDLFFELCIAGSFALPETMSEANKSLAMQQEFIAFCTDVGPAGGGGYASHPRAYGAFPRLLSRYVRDWGVLSLEEAIRRASATGSNSVMISDRGRIAIGQAADIVLFDYHDLQDRATFDSPAEISTGMRHVIVNGQLVLNDGKYTGTRPGRVLRGPGYQESNAAWMQSSGVQNAKFASLDVILQRFLRKHHLPGASLAIGEDNRIVYAKGYGHADVGTQEPVEPDSRFRIASISKPITSAAILQLVQAGKFELDTPVFEILDFNPFVEEKQQPDPRQKQITIRHLLQHRGGWDRDKSFDGMFQAVRFAELLGETPPANTSVVIRAMSGLPLDFGPGERYAYSNYGYCLLGRVIEKVSGRSYDEYVKQEVLAPLGIQDMTLGRTHLEHRATKEVRYYHPTRGRSVFAEDLNQWVPAAYGAWNLEVMDSHGAWIATASDLVKFASAFDSPDECPILEAGLVQQMFQRPEGLAGYQENGEPKRQYYALGWSVLEEDGVRVKASHSGSLPGTNTVLLKLANGRNVALLFNSRVSAQTTRVVSSVLPEIEQALKQIPLESAAQQ